MTTTTKVSCGTRSATTGITISSHTGSTSVVTSGSLGSTAIGDVLIDSAAQKYLITNIAGATLTIQRWPYSTAVDPTDGAGATTQRGLAWADIETVTASLSLTGQDTVFAMEFWNDGEITASSQKKVGTSASVDATRYFDLYPAAGQGAFQGTAIPLKYDQSKGVGINFTTGATSDKCFWLDARYTRIRGLQIKCAVDCVAIVTTRQGDQLVDGNLIEFNSSTHAPSTGLVDVNNGVNCTVTSNVLIAVDHTTAAWPLLNYTVNATGTQILEGNTIVQCSDSSNPTVLYGVLNTNCQNVKAKNNAVFGFSSGKAFFAQSGGTWESTSDYNATDLSATGTGTGTHNVTSATYASQFVGVTIAARDFTPKSSGSLHAGVVETTYLSKDIYGVNRDGSTPWISAAEISAQLAGTAAGVAAVTAALTTAIKLAGTPAASAIAQATLGNIARVIMTLVTKGDSPEPNLSSIRYSIWAETTENALATKLASGTTQSTNGSALISIDVIGASVGQQVYVLLGDASNRRYAGLETTQ